MERKKIILFVMFLLFSAMLSYSDEKIFRLAHDDYKPFHWYDKEQGKSVGIFIDICDEILGKRLGYKMVYTEYPWARAQISVKEGIDNAFITTPNEERLKYICVGKEAFVQMKKVIFTQPDNDKIEQLKKVKKPEDLLKIKGLVINDYIGNGWMNTTIKPLPGINIEESTLIDNVLNKLAVGRGDVFIEDPMIIHYNLKKLGLTGKVIELPVVLDVVDFKLCIDKNSELVKELPSIDQEIRNIRKDGTLKKILEKWK